MQTLDRALLSWEGKGREINIPFRDVADKVTFRTGDLAVLAGAPGGGKTLTATNWAWRSSDPILYLAQDSPLSVLHRLTALGLGRHTSDIQDIEDVTYWGNLIRDVRREELFVDTQGAHTVPEIKAKIVALTEYLMAPPHLVIIDNLMNMRAEGSNHMENSFYADILTQLKQVAIDSDVGVVMLHHVVRGGDHGKKVGSGDAPLKMTDLLFGGEREARHVWGVYRGWDNKKLHFQVLKQQDGEAAADGSMRITLEWMAQQGRLHNG